MSLVDKLIPQVAEMLVNAGPEGLLATELLELSSQSTISLVTQRMRAAGACFSARLRVYRNHQARHFAREDWRDAALAKSHQIPKAKEERRKPPKPKKQATPQQHQRITLNGKRQRVPVVPREVVGMDTAPRTVCPPCKLDRYAFVPPPGWVGQITRDWCESRLGGMR